MKGFQPNVYFSNTVCESFESHLKFMLIVIEYVTQDKVSVTEWNLQIHGITIHVVLFLNVTKP